MRNILVLFILLFSLLSCWENEIEKDIDNEEVKVDNTKSENEEISNNIVVEEKDIEEDKNLSNNEEENNQEIEKNEDINNEENLAEEYYDLEEKKEFDCLWAYEEIKKEYREDNVKKFWVDYNKCYFEVNDTTCWKNTEDSKIVNYEIILDYSQSMLAKIWSETRMDLAKKWVGNFIKSVDNNTNVWLVVYGHKWWSSCTDIEELVEIWKNNRETIIDEVNKYSAKWYTPIWKSLKLAWEKLLKYSWNNYENHILLISDWVESCKWNPIEEVKKLSKNNIIVSIIWFDVNNTANENLKEIASISWWRYFRANNLEELDKHLKDFENNHACFMETAMNNLDNTMQVQDNHFECSHELNMEKVAELRDIGLLFDAPKSCKTLLSNKTKIRFIKINKKIEDNKKEADKKLNENFEKNNDTYDTNNDTIEWNINNDSWYEDDDEENNLDEEEDDDWDEEDDD